MGAVEGLLELEGFGRFVGVLESFGFVLDPDVCVHVLGESGAVFARVCVLEKVRVVGVESGSCLGEGVGRGVGVYVGLGGDALGDSFVAFGDGFGLV